MATGKLMDRAADILSRVVAKRLDEPDILITSAEVPGATAKVNAAVKADPRIATVLVKSEWKSKIVMVVGGSILTAIAVRFGLDLSPEVHAQILEGLIAVSGVAIFFIKKYFTNTVTASSAGKTG